MRYNFVEIGTSDFRYLAGSYAGRGISVEPRQEHLDRLPDLDDVTKVCAAIGTESGSATLYMMPDEVIDQKHLPKWVRGCSSIGRMHPALSERFKAIYERNVEQREVRMITFDQLISDHDITSIFYLKVDTEGMDVDIVNAALDSGIDIQRIRYEDNGNCSRKDADQLYNRLVSTGYKMRLDGSDVVANKRK